MGETKACPCSILTVSHQRCAYEVSAIPSAICSIPWGSSEYSPSATEYSATHHQWYNGKFWNVGSSLWWSPKLTHFSSLCSFSPIGPLLAVASEFQWPSHLPDLTASDFFFRATLRTGYISTRLSRSLRTTFRQKFRHCSQPSEELS